MCTMQNLRLGALTLCAFRAISCLYLLIVGCRLVADSHLVMAFGTTITAAGAFVILCSFFGVVAAVVLNLGAVWHNKFLLVVYFFAESAIVTIQIASGFALSAQVPPDLPYDAQATCLLARAPTAPPTPACAAYAASDRYARMSLVWRSYDYLATSGRSTHYLSLLTGTQEAGRCCGFGAPTGCVADARPFPPAPSAGALTRDEDVAARYVCGLEAGWYAATSGCEQYVDESALEPVVGGCRFDYPLGECATQEVHVGQTMGCASQVDSDLSARIASAALAVTVLGFMYAAGLGVAACLTAKRPLLDVLPDHMARARLLRDPFAGTTRVGADTLLARLMGKPTEALKK